MNKHPAMCIVLIVAWSLLGYINLTKQGTEWQLCTAFAFWCAGLNTAELFWGKREWNS